MSARNSGDNASLHDALSFAIHSGDYLAASRLHSRMLENSRREIFVEMNHIVRGKADSLQRINVMKQQLLDALKGEIQRLLEEIGIREQKKLNELHQEYRLRQERSSVTSKAQNTARVRVLPQLDELKKAEAKYVEYRKFHLAEATRRRYNKLVKLIRDRDIAHAEEGKLQQMRHIEKDAAQTEREVKEKFEAMRQNIDLFRARREQEISNQIALKTSSDSKDVHKKLKMLNERKARLYKSTVGVTV